MVRFLKSQVEEFSTESELDTFMAMENLTNLLYVPASVLISVEALSKHGIIPYAAEYRWRLLLPASAYLTLANVRDLHICTRNFFIPGDEHAATHRTLLGQMQVTASLFMTLGGVSLLNACLIGLLHAGDKASEMAVSRHYVASFGFFLIGSAANTVPLHPEFAEYDTSRAMLTFQHIIASLLLCADGFLMLPDLIREDGIPFRDTLVTIFAVIASVALVFSSIVNYFHTLGLLRTRRRIAEANEEHEYPRKENSRNDPEHKLGFFNRVFGLFSSRSREVKDFSGHLDYGDVDIERPYEEETLIMSDASSEEMKWDDAADGRNVRDMEGGRYRSDSEERQRRESSRKNRRKGKKR